MRSYNAALYVTPLQHLEDTYACMYSHTVGFHLLAACAISVRVVIPTVYNQSISGPRVRLNGADAAFPQTSGTKIGHIHDASV